MKRQQDAASCLMFNDFWLRLIGTPIVTLLILLLFFDPVPLNWLSFSHGLVYTTVIWEGCRRIIMWMNYRLPNVADWRKRLLNIIGLCFLFVLIVCPLLDLTLGILFPATLAQYDMKPATGYIASYMMVITIGAIYESMRFFKLWKQALVEKEQVERAHLSSQLEGLRNQVNPHFLFNSLNTLIYLIPEEPDRAVRFVQQMSKVYRYVLESRASSLIALQEELRFLEAYIFLLHERFGDNLRVNLQVQGLPANAAIVPLTLQILFENAIKHNIISAEKPLHIEVFPENNHLIIRNNLQRKNQVMDSTGVGLENVKLRYRLLIDQEVSVIASAQYFTVALPMIKLDSDT